MVKKNVFRLERSIDSDNTILVALNGNGGVNISISEEKAVDSYNDVFECNFSATKDQSIALRDWLIANLKPAED